MAHLFDLILAPVLVLVAFASLWVKDVFAGVVFFILFGLLTSLAWVELSAPDIALVEAAVGAGVMGALFLGVLGRMEGLEKRRSPEKISWAFASFLSIPAGLLVLIGSACLFTLPEKSDGLWKEASELLSQSGASNLTTAVIINFRGYDTLLEIGVMLIVAVGVYILREYEEPRSLAHLSDPEPLITLFLHLLSPLMILFGSYLLWAGSTVPGGAFQAGSVLAGSGILLLLAKVRIPLDFSNIWVKAMLVAGLLVFLLTGFATMLVSTHFLDFPPRFAKGLVLLIEFFATLSIAVILLSLFGGCAGFLQRSAEEKKR